MLGFINKNKTVRAQNGNPITHEGVGTIMFSLTGRDNASHTQAGRDTKLRSDYLEWNGESGLRRTPPPPGQADTKCSVSS
jgi:hypothetical protein